MSFGSILLSLYRTSVQIKIRKFNMKKILLIITLCLFFIAQGFAQSKDEKKWIRNQFKQLSLDEKIAQLMIIRAHSNWDTKKLDTLSALIKKYNVGGLCFFQGGPVREAMQTNYYQSIAKTPLLITNGRRMGCGYAARQC